MLWLPYVIQNNTLVTTNITPVKTILLKYIIYIVNPKTCLNSLSCFSQVDITFTFKILPTSLLDQQKNSIANVLVPLIRSAGSLTGQIVTLAGSASCPEIATVEALMETDALFRDHYCSEPTFLYSNTDDNKCSMYTSPRAVLMGKEEGKDNHGRKYTAHPLYFTHLTHTQILAFARGEEGWSLIRWANSMIR